MREKKKAQVYVSRNNGIIERQTSRRIKKGREGEGKKNSRKRKQNRGMT